MLILGREICFGYRKFKHRRQWLCRRCEESIRNRSRRNDRLISAFPGHLRLVRAAIEFSSSQLPSWLITSYRPLTDIPFGVSPQRYQRRMNPSVALERIIQSSLAGRALSSALSNGCRKCRFSTNRRFRLGQFAYWGISKRVVLY